MRATVWRVLAATVVTWCVVGVGVRGVAPQPALSSATGEVVLSDAPVAAAERLETVDLVTETPARASGEQPIRAVEAQVSVGQPLLFRIPRPAAPRLAQDFYLVVLRFTLHPVPDSRAYERVKFSVALSTPGALAYDLLPKAVVAKQEVTKSYGFSPELKFQSISLRPGEVKYQVRFESLEPTVTSFGEGESRFYWTYTGATGQPLLPGTKNAVAIVQVPPGARVLEGSFAYDVQIARKLLGVWRSLDLKTSTLPARWDLGTAGTLS